MVVKGKRWILFFVLIWSLLPCQSVYGAEVSSDLSINDYNFSEIEEELKQQGMDSFSFQEVVKLLMKGEVVEAVNKIGNGIMNTILQEFIGNKKLLIQLVAVSIFSAVFTNFSNAFSSDSIGEAGFFVTYLVVFTILASSYGIAVVITKNVVTSLLNFMKVLVPAFCISVTTVSGFTSSSGIYGLLMLGVLLADYFILTIILPFANLYFMLQMVDHLNQERHFSKLAGMIQKGVDWGLKSLFTGIVGVQVLQSLLLPAIDSMKGTVVQRGVSLIPGAGQAISTVLSTMLGAGVIIKNSIGVAGLLCILVYISLPVIKLCVFSVGYQLVSSALQPIGDKRIVNCISGAANGIKMLLKVIWVVSALFMLSLVLAIASTNVVYYSQ